MAAGADSAKACNLASFWLSLSSIFLHPPNKKAKPPKKATQLFIKETLHTVSIKQMLRSCYLNLFSPHQISRE
jgi:hypothetical protein